MKQVNRRIRMKIKAGNILLIIILLIGIYTSILGNVSASDTPTIENITYSPDSPAPGSIVTFNATIGGNDLSVHLIVKECKEGLCFTSNNFTMNNTDTNEYQAEVMLTREDATYATYHLKIESRGIWYDYSDEAQIFNLSVKPDGDQSNGGNDGKGTPGFELICVLISVIFILLMYDKRKR
jgi:hypothetical protein